MSTINWLLVNSGLAVRFIWGALKVALIAGWNALDWLLNPVLSPVLALVNPVCTAVGDALYWSVSPLPIWAGLTIVSVGAGAGMLLAFGRLSNQNAIARTKDDIKANLLALKLYKDDLRVTLTLQGRLFRAILRLQRYMLVPVLVLALPMLLGLAQMGVRYQWRPLLPGERALIILRYREENGADLRTTSNPQPAVSLEPHPGIVVEVGAVPSPNELAWRVKAVKPGRHVLTFRAGEQVIEKELVAVHSFARVSAERTSDRWTAQLLHPIEKVLPATSPVERIEVRYPQRDSWLYGADFWLLTFFVISMASALLLAPVIKVRF